MKTSLGELEFQSGQLVKVGGARYNYMNGNKLLTLVGELGRLLASRNTEPERVQELLVANNELLERARKAEARALKAEEGWRKAADDASRLRFPNTTGQ